jgi:hypothetical protein
MPNILTPVGRLVAGSLYNPNTTDWQGNQLVTKTGPNKGQPRQEFFFALAIPKGQEQHWAQTEWGNVIYQAGAAAFPNGEYGRQDFAWKITDGDSQVPNRVGKTPASKPGYPGHWVLAFSSAFAPGLYTMVGGLQAPQQLVEPNAIQLGYYIQVAGSVEGNNQPGNPGVYLNHSMVCLQAYGEVIHTGPDAASVGFGGAALPPGASATPPAGGFNPAQPAPAPAPGYAPPPGPAPAPGYAPPPGPAPAPGYAPPPAGPGAGPAPGQYVNPPYPGAPGASGATPATAPAAGYVAPPTGAPGVSSAGGAPGNGFAQGPQ